MYQCMDSVTVLWMVYEKMTERVEVARQEEEDRRIREETVTVGSRDDEESTTQEDQEDDEGAPDEREIWQVTDVKRPSTSPDHHRGILNHRIRGCGPLLLLLSLISYSKLVSWNFPRDFLRSYRPFRTYSRCVSHQGSTGPFQGLPLQ